MTGLERGVTKQGNEVTSHMKPNNGKIFKASIDSTTIVFLALIDK